MVYPLIKPTLHLEAELLEVRDSEMYANSNIAITVYKNTDNNVLNWAFRILPDEPEEKCLARLETIANRISCNKLSVICDSPDDDIHMLVKKAGTYTQLDFKCWELLGS